MSPSARGTLLLVRLAPEIATKSRRTRRRFQRVLVENLEDALDSEGVHARVEDRWSRIFVEADDPGAAEIVVRVFGVGSVSKVEARVPAEMERIVETGRELFSDRIDGRSFAVRARRAGEHPFSSRDIGVKLGAALNPFGPVDLDDPDVEVSVEVRDAEAYLYEGRTDGPGGLPLGVEGRAVCLISGGYDSAAAAWLMLKRGIDLEYVFCNLAGDAYERSVVSVTKILADEWSYGRRPRLHVVDFGEVVSDLQAEVTPRYWQVVLKRLMYRTAEAVAEEVDGEAIVTGESVGQVSSQTLGNLRAIDEAAERPVFRPLLGYDKNQIIDLTRRVGTSALSARVREYCAILPDRPVTHARPASARDEEAKTESGILERAVTGRRVLDLRELDARDLVEPYLFADRVPAGATVIDCRAGPLYRAWHYPGAEHREADEVVERAGELEKERTYLLYCDHGVQSAQLAEILQRAGFEAYSFRGGTRGLRRWASEEGIATGGER